MKKTVYFLIILTVLLFSICAASAEAKTQAKTTEILVKIDPIIWTQSDKIDWHGHVRYITVVLNFNRDTKICGKPLAKSIINELRPNSYLLYGTACGKMWLLISEQFLEKFNLSAKQANAMAHHEAFHLAVQMLRTQSLVRIDNTLGESNIIPTKSELLKIEHFLRLLSPIKVGKKSPVSSSVNCFALSVAYSAMQPRTREHLRDRAWLEWPAEYYMRSIAYPNDDKGYWAFRLGPVGQSTENPLNILYEVSGDVVSAMDKKFSRSVWQSQYLSGESIINLASKAKGCAPLDPPVMMITVNRSLLNLVDP